MKQLTVEEVSPKAVRSAQLWLMGYLATKEPQDHDYEHDEWNRSDDWYLYLYHHGNKVTIYAYPVENYDTDYSRCVVVAEGDINPETYALGMVYKELVDQILGGK
jgi:hypothetical protein